MDTVMGIAVSKQWLDVASRPEAIEGSFGNDQSSMQEVVSLISELEVEAVVMEVTGALESPLASALGAAGLPTRVINPRQVTDVAKAMGRLAKTDRIDTSVIAHFTEPMPPEARPLSPTPMPRSCRLQWREGTG